MYFICKRLVAAIDYAAVLKYTGIIILINAVIAAVLYFTIDFLKVGVSLKLLLVFLLYLMILLVLNKKFKLNTELGRELKNVRQIFR
jgi:hypothetical protein